ncbi:MAG: hypothetical protein IJI71_03140 [Clostridia bacterium]|nr:hypothetical protein [Clostridia bacterium]
MNGSIAKFIPKGRENAISRKDLVLLTKLDDRTVRAKISEARESGAAICANTVTGGYYMAETEEDKQALLGELMSRMKKLSACYNAVRKTRLQA